MGIQTNGKIDTLEQDCPMGAADSSGVRNRAVVDTSAPFESVKDAVTRFGGVGYWKPAVSNVKVSESKVGKEDNAVNLEEEVARLRKELAEKERETLDVLKELDSTKSLVEELKSKLQKETTELRMVLEKNADYRSVNPEIEEAEKENHFEGVCMNAQKVTSMYPSSAPGFILMELKQAKLNFARTTSGLANTCESVESYNKILEKEKLSLEKTRERLAQATVKMTSWEEELQQTREKLSAAKDVETLDKDGASSFTREINRLSCEVEQFKKVSEAAKMTAQKAISEIELMGAKITTAERGLIAARKMKEAARASETLALAEIRALSKREGSSGELLMLTIEDYTSLTGQAQEAVEEYRKRIEEAMVQVNEESLSKKEVLRKIDEATEEVEISKKALEEALSRVEAANRGKLTIEEALRKWRLDLSRKKRSSLSNSTRFKNSSPFVINKREPRLVEVEGPEPEILISKPALKHTMSIGQILSRKLLLGEDIQTGVFSSKECLKRNMSSGQMLVRDESGCDREIPTQRKKFGLGRFTLLMTKKAKNKKKISLF